ncbi:MAG: ribonuclease P protein component [Bacteroidia bacterium]|nr:MAG: ribonuclease P protein component [Bacteroidia bacterium]
MLHPYAFPKTYSLKSRKRIGQLFKKGRVVKVYPLKLIYLSQPKQDNQQALRVLMSVSKRRFALAVDRNTLKRRCREAFRLNKNTLEHTLVQHGTYADIAVLYVGSTFYPFEDINKAMQSGLERISKELSK